jgi:glutamyl-tRNA reductase
MRSNGVFIVGVDHTSCPVEIREQLALSAHDSAGIISKLAEDQHIEEVVVLSTCARTEIILVPSNSDDEAMTLAASALEGLNPNCAPFIRRHAGVAAVDHVFRVTAGLESQVVGETEILGQVRAAVAQARARLTLGATLDRLFRSAIASARRLHNETTLGRLDLSAPSAVARVYAQHGELCNASVLVIGSGRMARLAAEHFHSAHRLVITGRTDHAAQDLSGAVGAEYVDFGQAIDNISQFDAVVCATRSSQPLIFSSQLASVGHIVLFDLAVPRNVDPSVRSIPGVTLYDVDSIVSDGSTLMVQDGLIQSILESEVREYVAGESLREVGPIIEALQRHVERVRIEELERVSAQIGSMDAAGRAVVEQLTQRLIDRMFHHLVVRLRLSALSRPEILEAAEFLFAHGEGSLFPLEVEEGRQPAISPPAEST